MKYKTETQHKLKEIPCKSQFDILLDRSTLSDLDKEIFVLHYLKEKNFGCIADILGYSETWVKKRHTRALNKLSKLI